MSNTVTFQEVTSHHTSFAGKTQISLDVGAIPSSPSNKLVKFESASSPRNLIMKGDQTPKDFITRSPSGLALKGPLASSPKSRISKLASGIITEEDVQTPVFAKTPSRMKKASLHIQPYASTPVSNFHPTSNVYDYMSYLLMYIPEDINSSTV